MVLSAQQGLARTSDSYFMRMMRGLFCVRCHLVQQSDALHRELAARHHKPTPFLCPCIFRLATSRRRTLAIICLLDILSLGLPCGCFYHGIGTALFGYRLRYQIRCRYHLQGKGVADLCSMMCIPFFAISQQECEMYARGTLLDVMAPELEHMP